jgi:hypothetical protein
MMPICSCKNCENVAELYIGKIRQDADDTWENPVYVCKECLKKLQEIMPVLEEEDDR